MSQINQESKTKSRFDVPVDRKDLPTVIFKGKGKFILVPSSKYPDLESYLKDAAATNIEANVVVDNFTIWAMSDVSIELIKLFIKFLSFFERVSKHLGVSIKLRKDDDEEI